jgi:hypothetical protein
MKIHHRGYRELRKETIGCFEMERIGTPGKLFLFLLRFSIFLSLFSVFSVVKKR